MSGHSTINSPPGAWPGKLKRADGMGLYEPPTYRPTNGLLRWIESRLPIGGLVYSSVVAYPTPRNLNYWWTFGAILTFMLIAQIATGVVLVMHYTATADGAFNSVEHIMRNVNYGWLLRYLHANGAAMFFLAVYIHMFRGMYYGSYKEPREVLWILGVIIYLLMMATGFMGYVLPWGQMSFWAATVITNLFSAIPIIGDPIVTWLWGGYAVGEPTLQRFFSLHYLLPFVIFGVVSCISGRCMSSAKTIRPASTRKTEKDTVAFTPYATMKDLFFIAVFCILYAWFVFYIPNYLGHADNYIPANPRRDADAHRAGMVLPAVLRHPALHPEQASRRDRPVRIDHRAGFPAVARQLKGEVGDLPAAVQAVLLDLRRRLRRPRLARLQAAGRRLRDRGRALFTAWYFIHFLIVLPLLGRLETPRPLPNSISEAVLKKKSVATVAAPVFSIGIGIAGLLGSSTAASAEEGPEPPRQKWSFWGPFGIYDTRPAAAGVQGLS